jgi:hypothetical protein
MFFEVLSLTYHSSITIESLTCRLWFGAHQYAFLVNVEGGYKFSKNLTAHRRVSICSMRRTAATIQVTIDCESLYDVNGIHLHPALPRSARLNLVVVFRPSASTTMVVRSGRIP